MELERFDGAQALDGCSSFGWNGSTSRRSGGSMADGASSGRFDGAGPGRSRAPAVQLGTWCGEHSSSGEGFRESQVRGQGPGAFRRSTGFDRAVWAEQAGSCYSGTPLRERIDGGAGIATPMERECPACRWLGRAIC